MREGIQPRQGGRGPRPRQGRREKARGQIGAACRHKTKGPQLPSALQFTSLRNICQPPTVCQVLHMLVRPKVVPAGVTLPGWRAHQTPPSSGFRNQVFTFAVPRQQMDILLPYPALTMCGERTSVDCQQASASWGQPEGHVTCLPLLKHSLQELIPPTALLSLPSHFPGVPQACQAQPPGADLCRVCLLGPH